MSRRFLAAAGNGSSARVTGRTLGRFGLLRDGRGVWRASLSCQPITGCRQPGANSRRHVAQIWLFGSYRRVRWLTRLGSSRERFWGPLDPSRRGMLNAAGARAGRAVCRGRLWRVYRAPGFPCSGCRDPGSRSSGGSGWVASSASERYPPERLPERGDPRVIDSSNELRPHLALVTGDLITTAGDPLDACLRQIARLRTDAGILGCMGNHEFYAQVEAETEHKAGRLASHFSRPGEASSVWQRPVERRRRGLSAQRQALFARRREHGAAGRL